VKNVKAGIVVACVVWALLAIPAATAESAAPAEPEQARPEVVRPAHHVGFFGRLLNGGKNIILAPLDIPVTIVRHTSEGENPIVGLFTGAAEGVVNGAVRAVAGITEVVTSPIPMKRYPLYERDLGERCLRDSYPLD